jgi:IS5 family transposase
VHYRAPSPDAERGTRQGNGVHEGRKQTAECWDTGDKSTSAAPRSTPRRSEPQKGGLTGKNPTDRAKAGSKHHLLVDRKGHPLAESLIGANVHDTHELFPLLDAVPDVKQPRGRPRHRPDKLHADKAYSSRKNRRGLRRRGITPRIARPGIESKQRLGRHRWVVERTSAWINQHRRLRVRDERRDDVHFALLVLGWCLILFRGLQT